MRKALRDTEKTEALKLKIKKAAALIGRLGGLGGKIGTDGKRDSKRRDPEVCRAAVNKRWDAYFSQQKNTPKS